MGKPLCRKCKAEVEEESRERYRRGSAKQHSVKNHYGLNVYRIDSNDDKDNYSWILSVRSSFL